MAKIAFIFPGQGAQKAVSYTHLIWTEENTLMFVKQNLHENM